MTASSTQGENDRAAVRHLGGQTAILMGAAIFTFAVGLPFQVYLARSLGIAGLGIVGIAEALVMTAGGLLSFGLAPLALRCIPEYRVTGGSRAIRILVLLGLVALVTVGLLGALLLGPLAALLSEAVGVTLETATALKVLAWMLPVTMLSFFLAQALRGFQEILVIVLSTSILALTSKVAISVGLFATMGPSVQVYALAMVLSQTLAIPPMAWSLWRLVRALPAEASPVKVDWRSWVSYAGTNYASGLLNTLVGNLDRVVIGMFLGSSAVGVLMVARQLQQFPTVLHQVVLTVTSPVFARLKAAGDMGGLAHQLHLANDWIVRMAAGLLLVLAIFSDHVLALYGADFAEQGTVLMLIMTLTAAINLGAGPVGMMLNMTGHHVALLRINAFTAIATFAGYFLLIPLFGVAGAGMAVLLGTTFNNGAAIRLIQQRLSISWYDPRFRGWLLPTAASAAMLLALRPVLEGLEGFALRAGVLVATTLLTYVIFFGFNVIAGLNEDDRELVSALRQRVAQMRRKRKQQTWT